MSWKFSKENMYIEFVCTLTPYMFQKHTCDKHSIQTQQGKATRTHLEASSMAQPVSSDEQLETRRKPVKASKSTTPTVSQNTKFVQFRWICVDNPFVSPIQH